MICPKCKKNIERVFIISECTQRGSLSGRNVISYSDLTVEKTLDILCSLCDASIKDVVRET